MMNMDVMRRLVAEAETGDCAMDTAHAALAHWDFDAGTLQDWRYSANAIYAFKQQGVTLIAQPGGLAITSGFRRGNLPVEVGDPPSDVVGIGHDVRDLAVSIGGDQTDLPPGGLQRLGEEDPALNRQIPHGGVLRSVLQLVKAIEEVQESG